MVYRGVIYQKVIYPPGNRHNEKTKNKTGEHKKKLAWRYIEFSLYLYTFSLFAYQNKRYPFAPKKLLRTVLILNDLQQFQHTAALSCKSAAESTKQTATCNAGKNSTSDKMDGCQCHNNNNNNNRFALLVWYGRCNHKRLGKQKSATITATKNNNKKTRKKTRFASTHKCRSSPPRET